MTLFDRDRDQERLPLTIVTGFLGSGKTTLINRLLRHPATGDTAVIVNEIGEVPLDHILVEPVAGEVAVLASGCVCCTVRSDLETTIRSLLHRRDLGEVPPFRRIVVETTGLADPAPVAQLVLNNPLLTRFVRLDSIVTTVDAVHAETQLAAHPEAVKQIALADRLLVTKRDLAGEIPAALADRLRALCPGAAQYDVSHGEIHPDRLFGAGPHDLAAFSNGRAHEAGPEGIGTVVLTATRPLDWAQVSAWLTRLRAAHGADLLRLKGLLDLVGETGPVAIHGVHHVFHPPVLLDGWPAGHDRRSRIVLIRRGTWDPGRPDEG